MYTPLQPLEYCLTTEWPMGGFHKDLCEQVRKVEGENCDAPGSDCAIALLTVELSKISKKKKNFH